MQDQNTILYIKNVIKNMPKDWVGLTTHRLDIYDESLAKIEFLQEFETLFNNNQFDNLALKKLPTAYDYIRLGHPLSSILEWTLAKLQQTRPENIISFDSQTMPILAILRTNKLKKLNTRICYTNKLPRTFNQNLLKSIYNYDFELQQINTIEDIKTFNGTTIFITNKNVVQPFKNNSLIDFSVTTYGKLGSVLTVHQATNSSYIADIQHVRRRETVAMTPDNTLTALLSLVNNENIQPVNPITNTHKNNVLQHIKSITNTSLTPLVASSGLSIQYAIMMGLIDHAQEHYKNKPIKFIVPPNCYGGTNDQARRVAASLKNVEIVDLPVDGDNNMVESIHNVLDRLANQDAVPYIIAEIPTNPRVEVPNLEELKNALSKQRLTNTGENAIQPVFILDQTFCPNVHFLGEGNILSNIKTISYASGSKFPSGGKCTAGYCTGSASTELIMNKIETHLTLCDNEATEFQYKILSQQLPTMIRRIADAYTNTKLFVNFIKDTLPEAKINFVSNTLAQQGFTPSVFSLDLPTKGATHEEKEIYKRALNLKLINLMITNIPDESKFCVSYGQLNGCYWTVPATSTQGTTKEGDKDYIVRASLSPNLDLEKHKTVFKEFVNSL